MALTVLVAGKNGEKKNHPGVLATNQGHGPRGGVHGRRAAEFGRRGAGIAGVGGRRAQRGCEAALSE